jgi:dihydroorotase (multifunctional complex type)
VIVDSVLINAKAYLKGQIVDCSIAIEEGKIAKIGKETQMPQADKKTDLHNLLVLPGLIDEHVHLRDEGRAYKEDFTSGTAAAAAGGFTTVLDMPYNDPVTMSLDRLQNRMMAASRRMLVNIGFYSELPNNITEIPDIVEAGTIGFKFFMGHQTGGVNVDDDFAIKEALPEIAKQKVPLALHAEDHSMLAANEAKLKMAKRASIADFLRVHTEIVELKAIQRILKAALDTDIQLHFCHVTSKEGLEAIAEAKNAKQRVTCEVTPNHLLMNTDDVGRLGSLAIMAPPLRDKNHRDALWKGLQESIIDTVGSDHAPHTIEEKMASSVWEVKPGVPGLETTLPLMMTLVKQKRLSIDQVVQLMAEKPAEIFGLTDSGTIEVGKNADLTVIDYNARYKIDSSIFKSKAKFSPYNGWEAIGKCAKTLVNGQLVFDEGEIVAKGGIGNIVRRGKT